MYCWILRESRKTFKKHSVLYVDMKRILLTRLKILEKFDKPLKIPTPVLSEVIQETRRNDNLIYPATPNRSNSAHSTIGLIQEQEERLTPCNEVSDSISVNQNHEDMTRFLAQNQRGPTTFTHKPLPRNSSLTPSTLPPLLKSEKPHLINLRHHSLSNIPSPPRDTPLPVCFSISPIFLQPPKDMIGNRAVQNFTISEPNKQCQKQFNSEHENCNGQDHKGNDVTIVTTHNTHGNITTPEELAIRRVIY